jgi:ABC-2 type transport system ATP-binding protein
VSEFRVRVADVSKRFGAVQALDRVSLHIAAGEVVVMIGVNGAGKSTLLRILGTRVLPDSGSAEVAGYDVVSAPREVRRRTGVVLSDERSWYWRLSGRTNLRFFAQLSELPAAAAAARTDELLRLVGLDEAADRRVDGYSSGMRSRLSLARSLLLDPPVLLLDEPSRALDPGVSRELRDTVVSLARDSGCAVLWVTHDLHEAAELADRVLVLDAGRIRGVADRPDSAAGLERLLDGAR